MKFYTDHDSGDHGVVTALRLLRIDVLTTLEAGMARAPDEDQLAFATAQERAIYTANYGDFARLHSLWLRSNVSHHGMILRPNQLVSVGQQVRAVTRIASAFEKTGTENLCIYLSRWLPLPSP